MLKGKTRSSFPEFFRWPVFSLTLCLVAATIAWAWWVSFDNPLPVERPHSLIWDAVSFHLAGKGVDVPPGINWLGGNPLIRMGAAALSFFGEQFWAVQATQLPFLWLLLVCVTWISYRLSGARAALIAPWIALFGPTTLGLALQFDDLLCLQSMVCLMAVLMIPARGKQASWFSFLAIFPAVFAGLSAAYSNDMLLFFVFLCFAFSLICTRWFFPDKGARRLPLILSAVALSVFIAGLACAFPLPTNYVLSESVNPKYSGESWLNNPESLLSYLSLWSKVMVGWKMVLFTLLSVLLVAYRRRLPRILPLVGWLLIPAFALAVISKRHDWYFVTAVPATFCIIAVGFAQIPSRKIRAVAAVLIFLMLLGSWGLVDDSPDENYGSLYDYFWRKPKPYLVSPKLVEPELAQWGRTLAETCSKNYIPVVFADFRGINGVDAFFLWHADKNADIGDLWWGPLPSSGEICFAFKDHESNAESVTFSEHLAGYRKQLMQYNPALVGRSIGDVMDRLERADKSYGHYRLLKKQGLWVIFGPREMQPSDQPGN